MDTNSNERGSCFHFYFELRLFQPHSTFWSSIVPYINMSKCSFDPRSQNVRPNKNVISRLSWHPNSPQFHISYSGLVVNGLINLNSVFRARNGASIVLSLLHGFAYLIKIPFPAIKLVYSRVSFIFLPSSSLWRLLQEQETTVSKMVLQSRPSSTVPSAWPQELMVRYTSPNLTRIIFE
jgi:hypothetical protein